MMEKHDSTYQISLLSPLKCCAVVAMLLFSVQGHSQSARASEVVNPEQSLRSSSLSSMQFHAYADRALEKINEWLTYMSLLEESRQDSLLYSELSGFVSDLFLNPAVELMYNDKQLTLEQWLLAHQQFDGGQILVSRHEWIDDWTHTGVVFERHLMLNLTVMEGEIPAWAGERIMAIYLTRIVKDFGGEKIETWEIRLGGME